MPLDPQTAALLEIVHSPDVVPLHQQTPVEARAAMRRLLVENRDPASVPEVGSVEDVEIAERPARIYRPDTDGPHPTMLFLHGGGYVIGDLDTHDTTCRRICRDADVVVVALDYRLAPEHPFPAAVEDCLAAARWVRANLADLGGTDVLGIGGDSAGGNLSAVVCQQAPELGIAAQLLLYPATDPTGDHASRVENAEGYFLDTETMAWFINHYATDGESWTDPRLAPLRGDLAGLPPAIVATAEFDPLRDEGETYAAALSAAGVPVIARRYDGLVHGFFDFAPFSDASLAATDELIKEFRVLLGG
ncbi:MAG: alpha/beta hydrolase [Nocardioides sp.]|nr:alpha/beta hydrolase [Nocardioides sp.]